MRPGALVSGTRLVRPHYQALLQRRERLVLAGVKIHALDHQKASGADVQRVPDLVASPSLVSQCSATELSDRLRVHVNAHDHRQRGLGPMHTANRRRAPKS